MHKIVDEEGKGENAAVAVWFNAWQYERDENCKAAKELVHYRYSYKDVQQKRELFIPTHWQNQSPTREEEPKFGTKYISKTPLIPFFLKTAFNEKRESEKFYIVLADSGMGKTTFMINLYLRYHSIFNFRSKYKMKLFPFGEKDIIKHIKEIKPEEARNTILLLDAFDEYKALLPPEEPDGLTDDERFRKLLDEIIDSVRNFREVVITSRTQYFPGQEDNPYELKIPRYGSSGYHTLGKIYLSPFEEKDIHRYLNKKYGIFKLWNRNKKQAALSVVKSSPKLMVRPMLLSYIDYLVDDDQKFSNTYEIYETLIEKWIEREGNKRKHKKEDREKFKENLYQYSQQVALEIYKQLRESDMLYLKRDDAIVVASDNKIDLKDYEITGQSLLTRDAEGNWKFAHKSIFEFFIAREAVENTKFWHELNLQGLDMAEQFCLENGLPNPNLFILIHGDQFLMGSPESEVSRRDEETQHLVRLDDFYMAKYPITVAQFETFIADRNYKTDADRNYKTDADRNYKTDADKKGGSYIWTGKDYKKKSGVNWKCDVSGDIQKNKQHPVIHISWNDASEYCKWLSKKSNKFRLPTEAEWEYACRAGTITPFNTGENLTTDQANYNGNYPYNNLPTGKYVEKTISVGSYPSNEWGLYDMHGNVFEWCSDWYGSDFYKECKEKGIVKNPIGPEIGSDRVLRGGSWYDGAEGCRSANRSGATPVIRSFNIGFRLVFVP